MHLPTMLNLLMAPDGNELIAENNTKFGMNKCNNLYFLNNVSDVQN